jgi:hypothetical protein
VAVIITLAVFIQTIEESTRLLRMNKKVKSRLAAVIEARE